jgi:hypothetical protein
MAKFKCIHTGNEFTFNDVDSTEMRKHDEYEEIISVEEVISVEEPLPVIPKSKVTSKKETT